MVILTQKVNMDLKREEQMKAIQDHEVTVVCDDCDFEDKADIKEYLNKSCPKCGAKDLITENDIKTHEAMCLLIKISNDLVGEVPEDSPLHEISVKITNGEIKSVEVNDE